LSEPETTAPIEDDEVKPVEEVDYPTQFIPAPEGYVGVNRWINWGGFECEVGGGYAPRLLNDIAHKISEIMLCVVAVVGTGGTGKTYFAIRLAEILDKNFNVEKQVVFTSTQFLELLDSGELDFGSCVIIDESQFQLSSRDWAEKEQKEYMKIFQTIRSKGLVVFIVALHEGILDSIARNYCLTHKITMLGRGIGKTAKFVMREGKKELIAETMDDEFFLDLPDAEKCDYKTCLKCRESGVRQSEWDKRKQWEAIGYRPCETSRATYERAKKAFLEERSQEVLRGRHQPKRPSEDALKLSILAAEPRFRLTDKKRYDLDTMILEVERDTGYGINMKLAKKLRTWLETEHPQGWETKKSEKKAKEAKTG